MKSHKGFTLLELVIYVAILSVIGIAISSFVLWVITLHTKTRVVAETVQNAQRAMDVMVYEIRHAKGVYAPTTSQTQLSLETTQALSSYETTSFVEFYLCGTRLCMKREGQGPIALTAPDIRIGSVSFTRVATGAVGTSVRISFEAAYENPNNLPELAASTTLSTAASTR